MERKILKKLRAIVGENQLNTAPEDLLSYSYDATGMEYPPAAVAFPGNAAEVAAIMRLAVEFSFPVVPRGAGTGMTGGALAVQSGLVLAMSRFNRILEIDRENQVAVVEPGVVTGEFQAEVARQGLFYPPDPASRAFCTLGGNVANGAGGPRAVKYGVTRDYVLGLEVVLPTGQIIHTGVRTAKGVVGYDLTRLFVGSEGTLGVITKIIVRLVALPAAQRTFLVMAADLGQATGLVSRIMAAGVMPSTLEYMDRTALKVVEAYLPGQLPAGTEALLLIEVDGDEEAVQVQAKRLLGFLDGESGLIDVRCARSREEADGFWKARRSISPASFALRPHKISEDVVVPRNRISDLVACTEGLSRKFGLTILTFGHAGDGNIHVNIMLDKQNASETERAQAAKRDLFAEVVRLGGTLSGEHGVGMTKAPYLGIELEAPLIELMRSIKRLFDPANVLNPGKIFPAG